MKIFANKSILKKIIIIFLLIFAISFTKPQPVHASVGGELMKPVCDLLVGLGDGVIKVIHIGMLGQYNTQLVIQESGLGSFVSIVLKVAAVAVLVICVVLAGSVIASIIAGGVSASLLGGLVVVKGIGAAAGIAIKGTIVAGILFFGSSLFQNQVVLPLYSLTPEEIFRNKIPIFDVNFVNPDSSAINSEWVNKIELDALAYGNRLNEEATTSNGEYRVKREGETFPTVDEVKNKGTRLEGKDAEKYYNTSQGFPVVQNNQYGNAYVYVYKDGDKEYIVKSEPGSGYIYKDSEVMIKDDKSTSTGIKAGDGDNEDNSIHGVAFLLQETISSWYKKIRIIAIVGMMSVLVYIGIRITISSASEQKAKYKELLKDWLIGMILLFSMHYIMNFSNVAVNKLTDLFNTLNPTQMVPIIEDNINGNKGKVLSTLEQYDVPKENGGRVLWESAEDSEGNKYVEWHTNLMGAVRMKAEAGKESGTDESFIGYSIMFAVLVIYTISFCWIYLKRVVYMAFLTLISPLVALTYPIDKVNDGSAQGFNYWFKEYIFNLLIQPVHLLIYTLLVSSAAEIAVKHWIYCLVVIGFLPQAEKILRKMFNFRAENTPGLMSGAIGTGLTMAGMRWLMGRESNDKSNKGKSDEDSQKNIGGTDKTKIRDMLGGGTSESDDSNSDETGGDTTTVKMNNNGDDDSYASETLDNLINGNKSATKKGTNNALTKGASNTISAAKGKGKSVKTQNNSSRKKNSIQGFSNMADKYLANHIYKAKNSKPLTKLGKGAAGAFGAATLGTLGLAAGIATGDASNAFQFAGAGIAGGYKLGSGTASSITNNIAEGLDIEGYKEAYGRGALGSEAYDIKQAEKYAKEYASRTEVIQQIQKEQNISSWKEAEEKTLEMAMAYGAKEGNYNIDDWLHYEKYVEEYAKGNDKEEKRKQAVAAHKTYNNFYDSKKQRNDIEKGMKDSMGINNSQARILSDAMYNWANIVN